MVQFTVKSQLIACLIGFLFVCLLFLLLVQQILLPVLLVNGIERVCSKLFNGPFLFILFSSYNSIALFQYIVMVKIVNNVMSL